MIVVAVCNRFRRNWNAIDMQVTYSRFVTLEKGILVHMGFLRSRSMTCRTKQS